MKRFDGVKLAIWDLDGTIIDSYGIYAAVLKEAAQLGGHDEPSETDIKHNYHGSLDESIKAALSLVDGDAISVVVNDFLHVQEDYYKNPDEHVFDDVVGLAQQLAARDISQVVVTNRDHADRGAASPRYLVENSRLKPYIADFVCGEDAPVRKPDPNVINGLTIARDLRGDQMIVIGDQFVDAQLAKNLGAQAFIVNRDGEPIPHLEQLEDDDSIIIVHSLDEVMS